MMNIRGDNWIMRWNNFIQYAAISLLLINRFSSMAAGKQKCATFVVGFSLSSNNANTMMINAVSKKSPKRSTNHDRRFNSNTYFHNYYSRIKRADMSRADDGKRWISMSDEDNENQFDPTKNNDERMSNKNKNKNGNSWKNMWHASLWVAGCTVGGGFLALPSIIMGGSASWSSCAVTLVLVWLYFWSQSMVLMNCFANSSNSTNNEGISSLAQETLGRGGKWFTTLLLILVTEATLVSQISRAGTLLSPSLFSSTTITSSPITPPHYHYIMTCAFVSTLFAIPVFFTTPTTSTVDIDTEATTSTTTSSSSNRLNSLLVFTMISFAMVVFVRGITLVSKEQLVSSLLPSAVSNNDYNKIFTPIVLIRNWMQTLPSSLPTLLQLMVYGEILPIIYPLLIQSSFKRSSSHTNVASTNKRRIHENDIKHTNNVDNSTNDQQQLNRKTNTFSFPFWRANVVIAFGSCIPLILLLGWSALGISLSSTITATHTATTTVIDPVQKLLFDPSSNIRFPLFGLACAAISTTILSSYEALYNIWNDIFPSTTTIANDDNNNETKKRRWIPAMSIVVPSCAVASISPDIFLSAIDFAGSYPVLWLWGVLPPIMSLRQRQINNTKSNKNNNITRRSTAHLWFLLFISVIMVGMSAIPDAQWLFMTITTKLKNLPNIFHQ